MAPAAAQNCLFLAHVHMLRGVLPLDLVRRPIWLATLLGRAVRALWDQEAQCPPTHKIPHSRERLDQRETVTH